MSEYAGCHMYTEDSDGDEAEIIKPAVDVFEIEDYTAATEWEDFTDQLENILRCWKLAGPDANTRERSPPIDKSGKCEWRTETASLKYINFPFIVKYYKYTQVQRKEPSPAKSETSSKDGEEKEEVLEQNQPQQRSDSSQVMEDISRGAFDFMCEPRPIPLTYFGLSEMIIISPSGNDILGNETRANQILGSINIALQNTGCPIPCLVQVMDPRSYLYVGTSIADNCRLEFSSVALNKKPMHVSHLTGLLQLFKNRICSPLPIEVSSVTVSARLSYQLDDWASYAWSVDPPDLDLYNVSGETDFIQLKELPLGCVSDPIAGLTLHTSWRDLNEDLIVDNSVHSDLDPLEAPEWSIGISLQERPECLLAKHIRSLLDLCRDRRSSKELLASYNLQDSPAPAPRLQGRSEEAENVAGLFDKLSSKHEPIPHMGASISELAQQVRPLRSSKSVGGPLSPGLLDYILGYLFPDSGNPNAYPFSGGDSASKPESINDYSNTSIKTCPFDGLLWRLSTTIGCCYAWAGPQGVSHIVHEFLLEARYRWEQGILLPGVPQGPPDTSTNLLHQKLQMLNCCIAKRQTKDKMTEKTEEFKEMMEVDGVGAGGSDTEEEFFECEGEQSETEETEKKPVWEQAEGRMDRIGDLKLLNGKNFLYRPYVQEPAPMTEDQLAEQQEVLMQLGSDVAGSEVRAKLQSANLLSDMESFKAANPGCELADFVRWHSPRDWTEHSEGEDKEKSAAGGGLSARMKAPGNMWQDLWSQARAVPAHRQKRLFDETREAEKVLQFITNLGPGEVAQLVLPTILQAAHLRILSSAENLECLDYLHDLHSELMSLITSLSKLQCPPEIRHYRGNILLHDFAKRETLSWQVLESIAKAELHISRFMSLRKKFVYDLSVAENEEQQDALSEMERFVHSLCQEGAEVKVPGAARGPAGRLIQAIFRESSQDTDPRPAGLPSTPRTRQFVLRCLAGRPLPSSRPTPQRLYARFAPHEFRLNGVYTLDRQYL